MVFRATLLLVLLAASAAGSQVYTWPGVEDTAAVPAVEPVEEAAPAAEELAVEAAPAAVELAEEAEPAAEEPAVEAAPAAEEPAVEEPAAEAAADETPEVAPEETASDEVVEEVVEETVEEPVEEPVEKTVEEPVEEQPISTHPEPADGPRQPAHGPRQPAYGRSHAPAEPACSLNTTQPWCLDDSEYPRHQIAQAISYDRYAFLALYQDVVASTSSSVDRLEQLQEETYLCSSRTSYVQPLRARNADGKWRVVVNGVKVHYDTFTQTVRLEECLTQGEPCPLVPQCYESSCLQQNVYQRLLVFDAQDYYQPFAMETFKLPSACACSLGGYEISH